MVFDDGRILDIEKADIEYKKIEVDEKVPSIEDSILMLLSVLPESPIISRTLMMKEVFLFYADFLKQFRIHSDPVNDAGFFAYKYGPYSLRVNISLASLALSGKITITDYADYLNEKRKKLEGYENLDLPEAPKKYQACFQTNVRFSDIFLRYIEPFVELDIDYITFKDKMGDFKRLWDQKTAKGIILYIYNNSSFSRFVEKSELKDKYPEAFGGRVREDYIPRKLITGEGQH
ncbi:MAG: hypothetical protein M0Z77_10335 [Thermoplasmatales archaeon]|nr:hypothetical protein [Candidatus Thermoplasmatota archaeon]MCL6003349.1 hypothetical protein [Candidatus Thermoplasmatota archaeon]MDA8056024.1 hypothetical protein [Thermoplasmatales archaeon]